MELTESRTLTIPRQQAWEALNDTEILKSCIPGCESIEADGENAYTVALVAAIGPVKARFKGRMQLADVDAPCGYTIQFEGQGGAAGFGKGQARVTLEPDGEAAATLHYTVNAQVGGKLAQIGSRLVDGAARKIAAEFFTRFGARFAPEEQNTDESARENTGKNTGGNSRENAGKNTDENMHTPVELKANPATNPNAANDAQDAPGEQPKKRKRSWTAWISKS